MGEAKRNELNTPPGYVFIVFSRNGTPIAVGLNAQQAWERLAGGMGDWKYWRKWYRSNYGYFGKRISLT